MPARKEPYLDRACYIFIQNLFPEEGIREKLNTLLNTDSDHLKKIVHVMGGDVAGAVEILPKGDSPYEEKLKGDLEILDHSLLINNIEDKPFDVTKESAADFVSGKVTKLRVRMSLAGAQLSYLFGQYRMEIVITFSAQIFYFRATLLSPRVKRMNSGLLY